MPNVYKCGDCQFEFSIGWFHYHNFESGHGSETQMICRNCGNRGAVQIAIRGREDEPELLPVYCLVVQTLPEGSRIPLMKWLRRRRRIKPDEAKALIGDLPLVVLEEQAEGASQKLVTEFEKMGVPLQREVTRMIRNPAYGEQMRDVFVSADGPDDEVAEGRQVRDSVYTDEGTIDLGRQSCVACGTIGGFASKLSEDWNECPLCHGDSLAENGWWIT